MDIQGLDANRVKTQQKTQKNSDESAKFTAVLGQKSAELQQQQRVVAATDIDRQALRRDKDLMETGEDMDSEEIAEELFLKKKKKLTKKVEDLLRSQQQGLGL
jgi:hypothetical protein